jgi:hypothetical protein
MIKWWWLSFANPDTGKFLGLIIINGNDFKDAHRNVNILNINPGGQILGHEFTAFIDTIKPEDRCRLLTKKEAHVYGKSVKV